MKNWKTSVAGILSALVAWANATVAVLDGLDSTRPDWNVAVVATIAAVAFIFAKDSNSK